MGASFCCCQSVWLGELELGGLFVVERADESTGGFGRDVVELTMLDAAEVERVADAVTNVDGGGLEGDVAAGDK